ncbi:unnamed protein product [Lampetra fluviatilis]
MGDVAGEKNSGACALFDRFVQAGTCKGTLRAYQDLCELVDLKPSDFRTFYPKLKSKLNYWKAKGLWSKIDKRAAHKDYKKGKQCSNVKCLIIGAGPCGLRSAIELALLGAKVVVVEKRDAFSRNNVLHLWPYTIHDLKALGAKKFHGKFCAGAIDHISIRQLQLILLKVSLLLGVEIHVNVEFKGIMEPPEDQENDRIGWRAEIVPNTHPVAEYEFDVIIGADGHRNTLQGFRRKEFRGKLAIAITANFINRNTTAEAKVEELSGVAFIFNQKFFTDLRASKGIDLENIVYYKDDTHYFVMTAKKQSLLEKGVILQDYPDTEMLLSRENVDQEALQEYARGAADFSTNHQLPSLDFAINHYGQPDVAMFDFTCMYASENAALVRERHGHRLLVALVGDSLLEPFWPMGTGCARGFLAAFDSAWMIRSWAQGTPPLEVLAERESIYRLLPQTTPENINKNFSQYSIDPTTRYPNVNLNFLRASQVRHLYDTGEARETAMDVESALGADSRLTRHDSIVRSSKLLNWCQRQTEGYRSVRVVDFTGSWKSGLALCAIIHRYRPDLIDFDSLDERNVAGNNQLAFDVAEREFGISPIITGQEVAGVADPDKLSMVMYLSQFYEMFRDTLPPAEYNKLMGEDDRSAALLSTKSPISFLSKLGQTISRKRTPRDKKEKEVDGLGKRRRTGQKASDEEEMQARREDRWGVGNGERRADAVSGNQNKVKSMANQLLAKFEENAPLQSNLKRQGSLRKEFPQNLGGSDTCYFCGRRVYVMERLSAEGKFFHRGCFKCNYCDVTLRLGAFAFDVEDGKFYCKPHYCYRLSGFMQRKMQRNEMALDPAGAAATAALEEDDAAGGGSSSTGGGGSVPKRTWVTPERIELESGRLSARLVELVEVPEETLAQHNLSGTLERYADMGLGLGDEESSVETEDQEEEEEEEAEEEGFSDDDSGSDLGGMPWKEAVKRHEILRGRTAEEAEREAQRLAEEEARNLAEAGEAIALGLVDGYEDGDEEYDDDDEEEEEEEGDEEDESSDEGEYYPWERELQSGRWWCLQSPERDLTSFLLNPTQNTNVHAYLNLVFLHPSTTEMTSSRNHAVMAWLRATNGAETTATTAAATAAATAGAAGASNRKADEEPRSALPSPGSDLRSGGQAAPWTKHADATAPVNDSMSPPPLPQSQSAGASPLLSPLSPIPSTQSPSVILGLSQVSLISPKSFADQASPRSLQSPNGNLEQPRMTAASPAATKPQLGTVSPSAYFTPSSRPIPSPRTQLSPGLVSGLPQVPIVTPRSFMQRAGVSWEQPSNTQKTVTATEKNEKPKSEMTHAKDISAGDAGGVFRSTAAEEKDTIDRHRLEAELSWARFGIGGQERRQSPTASDSSGTISTPESARARSPAPRAEPGAGSGTVEPRPENQMSIPARPVVKSAAASKAEWLNTPSSLPASDSLSTALSRNHVAKTVGNGEELNHVDILHPEDVSVCLVEDVHPGAEGEVDPNTSTSLLLTPPSSPPPPPPPNEEPASLFVYRPHTTPPRARPLSLDAHLTPKRSAPSRLQDTLRQKSLEESIDEIPFADEEEDGDDDDEGGSCADFRSPGSSVFLDESFHTPPTSRPAGRTRPVFDRDSSSRKTTPCSKISPEAKEVAESRLREREQVVKSNVLRDAMAQQREKLKGRLAGEASFFSSPAYAPHGKKPSTSSAAEAATKPPSLMPSDRHVDSEPARRKHESAKGSKSVKLVDGDALKEESQVDDLPLRPKKKIPAKDLGSETSHTSSEDVPGKSKKRASLFSPRKNKKDKAAKMESQRAADAAALANESNASIAKSRSPLWKVFSHGYRKERRKEKELEERTRSSTTSSVGTVDSATEQPIITATPKPMALHPVLAMRRQASQTEDDSELSSEEVLNDPSCQRGRRREKPYTEEELNEKLTRRVQRAARKQAKQEELKRLHRAQIIQRQLEEVEEKQRALEERGVAVEKALRGEAGLGKKDDPRLMQEWFKLVQEKNTMVRYESELMIFARELELEDRQSRLQQDLRERMAVDDAQKSEAELSEEKRILSEMLDVVEQRDSLVALLEEQRLREREEDRDIEAIMLSRGYTFNWT